MRSEQYDWTYNINNQKKLVMDVSEWDRVSFTVVAPVVGSLSIYGTNDGGAVRGVTNGNAALATNFTPVQMTDLSTGTKVTSISAAGNYEYDVNTNFLRLAGGGVNVYKLISNNMKVY